MRKKSATMTIHRMLAAVLCVVLWSSVEAAQTLTLSKQLAVQLQTRKPGQRKTLHSPLTSRAEEKQHTRTNVQDTLESKAGSAMQRLMSKGFVLRKLPSKGYSVAHKLTPKIIFLTQKLTSNKVSFTDTLASPENDRMSLTRMRRSSMFAESPESSPRKNPSVLQTWPLALPHYQTTRTNTLPLSTEGLQEVSPRIHTGRSSTIKSTESSSKLSATETAGSSGTESVLSCPHHVPSSFERPSSAPESTHSLAGETHRLQVHTSSWSWTTGSTRSSSSDTDSDGITTGPGQQGTTLPASNNECTVSGGWIVQQCTMIMPRDTVHWTPPVNNCDVDMTWSLSVPEEHLVIFEGYVLGTRTDSRFFYTHKPQTTDIIIYKNAMDESKDPVHSHYFSFRAAVRQYERPSIIFRYNIWPVHETPVKLHTHRYVAADSIRSQTVYNCSYPYKVPELWKCDMVQQCSGLEDEPADCSYRISSACGPLWIQFGDQCLHVMSGYGLHKDLDKMCKRDLDAVQMPLVKKEERDFVADVVWTVLRKPGDVYFPLRKVKPVSDKLSHLYRYLWQWGSQGSPIAYQQLTFSQSFVEKDCALVRVSAQSMNTEAHDCSTAKIRLITYVCTKPVSSKMKLMGLQLAPPHKNASSKVHSKICPDGSVVQKFHPCPVGDKGLLSERYLPLFPCTQGPHVHYTLFCDGLEDCLDGSDEDKCNQADLASLSNHGAIFFCRNYQLINSDLHCNGVPDCFDGSDEDFCESCQYPNALYLCQEHGCLPNGYKTYAFSCLPDRYTDSTPMESSMSSLLFLDGYGMANLTRTKDEKNCPETHFQCLTGYCIPKYLLNNGEQDCPLGEDENIPTENYTCPGYYRCYGSGTCVHADSVCDGIPHCPNKDDERYCQLVCPRNCTCEGHAFTCRQMFDPLLFLQVRYLDLSGTHRPTLKDINRIPFLRYLNLSRCALTRVSLSNLSLLTELDLGYNQLGSLGSLQLDNLTGLLRLILSGNHLTPHLDKDTAIFTQLVNLRTLRLAATGLEVMTSGTFSHMKDLTDLHLNDNPLRSFPKDVFAGLKKLRILRADDSRLCCAYFHHDIQQLECDAPRDELSSCSDLLKSDFYRACLWVFSVLAITGNAGVIIYRLVLEKEGSSVKYRMFVVNLSLSDFLMGVYIAIIGAADAVFRGQYVSKEAEWKESAVCKAAGFLGLLSSEVSAFTICLITLDRFMLICFPLNQRLQLTKRSSRMACVTTWIVGLVLAITPALLTNWQFYGLNGICLPLPITRTSFPGQDYAFGVFIVLNFIIFLIIGAGQAAIFYSIYSSAQATIKVHKKNEVVIARRLFLIVLTDFCCWFPIGLMGLLASRGLPIPGVVNVLGGCLCAAHQLGRQPLSVHAQQAVGEESAETHGTTDPESDESVGKRAADMATPRSGGLIQYCLRTHLVDRDVLLRTTEQGAEYRSNVAQL